MFSTGALYSLLKYGKKFELSKHGVDANLVFEKLCASGEFSTALKYAADYGMNTKYSPLAVVEMMLNANAWNMALKAREKYNLTPAQLSIEKVLRHAAKAGDFVTCIRVVD